MSRRKLRGRPVDGVVLLDKPIGLTSNQALQAVKRLFDARKAGHTGSLDPLATGMLPICLGEATKLSAYLLNADKCYLVECRLGVTTETGDREGTVRCERPVPRLSASEVEAVLGGFRGQILQVPPMYSALRHQGQRLYELARRGLEVERQPRSVSIHELRCEVQRSSHLALQVRCSKGTYVRSLVEDIGEALGCGAHVTALRRVSVGPYEGSAMVTLEGLGHLANNGFCELDSTLLPVDSALEQWPRLNLNTDLAFYLRNGQPVLVPRAPADGMVRLYDGESHFLGVGEIIDDGRVAPRRLVQVE
jgi:tRNA pseudouridine55 synthase